MANALNPYLPGRTPGASSAFLFLSRGFPTVQSSAAHTSSRRKGVTANVVSFDILVHHYSGGS
jgi:hypothetical protein